MRQLFASVILALSLSAPALAAETGASVSGRAWGDFVIGCSTCPHFLLTMNGTPVQSVTDPSLAAIDYDGGPLKTAELAPYTLGGGASYAGFAGFEGPLSLPWLGARASTNNEFAYLIADPVVPVGIDLYSSSVDARTLMKYVYTGSAPTDFTFHLGVDGTVTNAQSSVFASAALYRTDATGFETGLIDFGYASFHGTGITAPPTPFAGSFTVDLHAEPGDSFWLIASLSVSANHIYDTTDVGVDAYDTLRVTGIDGDTALLAPAAVPEPSTVLLMLLGVAVLVVRRQRA